MEFGHICKVFMEGAPLIIGVKHLICLTERALRTGLKGQNNN